ncbi:MAG: methylated-DNA--[protein]-cysteine S-methyltransferase [Acidimicrobiales bacterium]
MTDRAHTTIASPLGPLTAVADDGAISALYLDGQQHRPPDAALGRQDRMVLGELRTQLDAYFAGALTDFDLSLAPSGTPFQQRVWAALQEIAYGSTATYGEIAIVIGAPRAARAVGLANGRNPISIVVPCHRVVGAGGALTGYAGGLERKQWLLDHEHAHPMVAAG